MSDVSDSSSVAAAFKLVRKVRKLDQDGRCFFIIFKTSAESFPEEFAYLLNITIGSTMTMRSTTNHGIVFRKSSAFPRA